MNMDNRGEVIERPGFCISREQREAERACLKHCDTHATLRLTIDRPSEYFHCA
jgi:hypothetical protein